MAKFSNPTLFSKHFKVHPAALEDAGLIDPFLDVDTQLFIDPILLRKSEFKIIKNEAHLALREHFSNVFRLLRISKQEGDQPWRAAQKLLDLKEAPFNGLGYGKGERSGASRPAELRDTILRTSKEVVELGATDPEMISLMSFFEENVGPDTISDLTTRIILAQLSAVTASFCRENSIAVTTSESSPEFELPHFTGRNGKSRAFLLVPRDIVRSLPVAQDWSQVQKAADANQQIRDRVNSYLAGIARPTVTERKDAIRSAAFSSAELLDAFLKSMKEAARPYDPIEDEFGYYALKRRLGDDLKMYRATGPINLATGPEEVKKVVLETIEMFKHHVENGNLWEELWASGKPKRERAAQLIYFAIADCYCKANNIDISPEANMGGGPIDFKFSVGYNARVLVEMKRSTGTVVHGYEKQLEIYKDASRTSFGIFVILDYGDNLGPKLTRIQEIQKQRLAAGRPASDIIVIDARRKVSASKRK